MKSIETIKTEVANLNINEKENLLIDYYNQAIENNHHPLAEQIASYIIGDDRDEANCSARLRLFCLHYLTDRYFESMTHCDETNEDIVNQEMDRFMDLLWRYKWVLPDLPMNLDISKEQMEESINMMLHYYKIFEFSQAPIYKVAMLQAIHMGDKDTAQANYQLWQDHLQNEDLNDLMDDCPACEQHDKVLHAHFIGNYEKALQYAKPLLSGELSCADVPHETYPAILDSLIQHQQFAKAKKLLPIAIHTISQHKPAITASIPQLIEIAMRLDEQDTAIDLANQYHQEILTSPDELVILKFFIATAQLSEHNYQTAQELAEAFDQRNGNQYYQEYLAEFTGRNLLGQAKLQ